MRKPKISEEMAISAIIQKYPETSSVFLNYGLYCFGCLAASSETIKIAAKLHKINLDKFLEDLNEAAERS